MALQTFADQSVTITARSGDTVQAGNGNDTLQSSGSNLSNVQATLGDGADVLQLNFTSLITASNDNFVFGNGNDQGLVGTNLANSRVTFGNGNDSIQFFGSAESNDTVVLGTGNDTVQVFSVNSGSITITQAAGGGPSVFDFFGSPNVSAAITITNAADVIANAPNALTTIVAVDGFKAPYVGTVTYGATSEAIAAPYNIAQPLPYFISNLLFDPAPHWGATIGIHAAPITLQFSFMQKVPSYATSSDGFGFAALGADLPASVIGQSPQQIVNAVSSHAITLTPAELQTVTVLANWQTVANINFVAAADSDSVAVRFGSNNQGSSSSGYAYTPVLADDTSAKNISQGGDVYANNVGISSNFYTTGQFGGTMLAHEIGHVLGLGGESGDSDTHDTLPGGVGSLPGGVSGASSGETSTTEDNLLNTVQTHNNQAVNNVFPNGPQPFDIAVAQYLYGPSSSYHPNASHVWSFSSSGGTANLVSDGAGFIDTISAAAATLAAFIDLRPGHWDYVGTQSNDVLAANQLFIDYGTLVQVAIGGTGNDTLVGNDANDSLSGGAGNDLLVLGPGSDTLDGGTGTNTALFADTRANYSITSSGGVTTVSETVAGRQGTDILSNVQFLQFSDQTVNTTGGIPPATTVTAGAGGTLPSFDATASIAFDLTNLKAGQSISGLTGNDFITVGGAGVTITASSGNDQVLIPASVAGTTSFTGLAGNDSVTASGGTNVLVGGSGGAAFSLAGGTNTAFTGSGQTSFVVTGGVNTVIANQGSATVTDSSASLLLGLLGGSDQVSLNAGAPVVIATAGSSTIAASAAAPLIGMFGGTHTLSLGSGGGTVFSLGATVTIQGGAGLTGVDLVGGKALIVSGPGLTELFVNGGSNTLLAQSNSGTVLVSGFTSAGLALDIPHNINGNNFTAASQVSITHNASGDTLLNVGAPGSVGGQVIWLVGINSLNASAITLV